MKIIGIASGSGAGKSTVSYALEDEYPDAIEVLNLDDYQKVSSSDNLPMIDGIINWDHPDIIRWNDLVRDILLLKNGKSIEIKVWAHRSNPNYATHRQLKPRIIQPKAVLIVEGYLSLYNPQVRDLFDTSFYLEVNDEIRNARRGKNNIVTGADYEQKVLIPMHKQYVESTKKYADYLVDVSVMSIEEVCSKVRQNAKLDF